MWRWLHIFWKAAPANKQQQGGWAIFLMDAYWINFMIDIDDDERHRHGNADISFDTD